MTVRLTQREQGHIASAAAVAAAAIARELQTDRPEPLLEHIPALDALADLARWATEGAALGALTGRGLLRLAAFREAHVDAFQDLARERDLEDADIAVHERTLDMFNRAIAIASTKDY